MGVVVIKKRAPLGSGGDIKSFLDGSMISFTTPSNISEIGPFVFDSSSVLKYIHINSNITEIDERAFNNCVNVLGLEILSTNISFIGNNAFHQVGRYNGDNNAGFSLICYPHGVIGTTVGDLAFVYAKFQEIIGNFADIGTNAFQGVGSGLTGSNRPYININIKGKIGSRAFSRISYTTLIINKNSNVERILDHAFEYVDCSNSLFGRGVIDFRNSTFSAMEGGSTFSNAKYINVFFPESLSTAYYTTMNGGNEFASSRDCNVCFLSQFPLDTYGTFMNGTNNKIFAPYKQINLYRTYKGYGWPTNYVYGGWAPGGTFSTGETLPTFNDEGYMLTWYSDIGTTSVVTEVDDPNEDLFCIAGQTKEMFRISNIFTTNCSISISDGVKSYSLGDFVEKETVLTITATPNNQGYVLYAFTVNRNNFVSGNTITVSENIEIFAAYWDEQNLPIDPVFSNNSWDTIYAVFRGGLAMQYWSLGDTKSVTLTNGDVYHVRIADATFGRYEIVDDGLTSNGVLEFVEVISPAERIGGNCGWALCSLKKNILPQVYEQLPSDLKAIMRQVFVLSGIGGYNHTGGTSVSPNYLFLPAEHEIVTSEVADYSFANECPAGQYGLYALNPSQNFRIKNDLSGTPCAYWYRSPNRNDTWTDYWCSVSSSGYSYITRTTDQINYAPCFAI